MTVENGIRDIAIEWDGGVVRGFRSKQEAERFIERICKKTAPDRDYSIIYYISR